MSIHRAQHPLLRPPRPRLSRGLPFSWLIPISEGCIKLTNLNCCQNLTLVGVPTREHVDDGKCVKPHFITFIETSMRLNC